MVRSDGGPISSESGALPGRGRKAATGIITQFADRLVDRRDQAPIESTVEQLVAPHNYALALLADRNRVATTRANQIRLWFRHRPKRSRRRFAGMTMPEDSHCSEPSALPVSNPSTKRGRPRPSVTAL
ncbi:MAG: hypothetical protein JW889_02650 [Verrucomicrobia bacterium]|nr:hypothetical protein [Verrucomicrobiota bacterium]